MNKKSIMKKILSLLLVFCMVSGIAFVNVGIKEVQADDTAQTETTDTTALRSLTFADFGITDGTHEGGFGSSQLQTVDSTKVSSLTLADSEISGYMQFDDAGRSLTTSYAAYWVVGHTAWAGLQVLFYPYDTTCDRIVVSTTSVTDKNGETFYYILEDGLLDDTFKITLSFKTIDSDGDTGKDDLALRLYIDDALCTAYKPLITNTTLSTGETEGEYYICDYKADNFRPYMRTWSVSSTDETCYKSITVNSCELPYTSTTTFTNYGLDDQVFGGTSIGGTVTNTMEYTKFVGEVTIGGAGIAMINYGATASDNSNIGGLQLQIVADTGEFWVIPGTRLGTSYLNETDGDTHGLNCQHYSSGFTVGTSFVLSFNTIPWDWDGDGNATDGKIEICLDGKLLKDSYVIIEDMFSDAITLVNRIGVLAGGNFESTSTVTIASVAETTDDEEESEDTVVDKRILTFADFGIEDGTYEGFDVKQLQTVDSTKVSSLTLADSEISGYIQFEDADRTVSEPACWVIGHDNWEGLLVQFNPSDTSCDQIVINTSSVTDTNKEAFQYKLKDGLFDDTFKITLSFETVDSDRDNAKDDLALRLYINDELCAASGIANTTLSKGETEGEYYICDYKADNFRPYIRMRSISSTNETMYNSLAVNSCELPYKYTSTFVDYCISDGFYETGIKSGTYPFALEDTKLIGNITIQAEGASNYCLINYGGTTTSESSAWPQLGGLHLQVEGSGKFYILAGTRLGTSYLNATDPAQNMSSYSDGIPLATEFAISFNTIPWDWDGDGAATDGKIEIRIDDSLLKNEYIIIENMFLNPANLVNRFSFVTGGHTGTDAAFDVKSQAQDVSRLRKLELADFGLANGEYIEQKSSSTGPTSLLNTMMEVNLSVEESTAGSWIHYAVPLDKGGWYGNSFRIMGDTITVVNASESITGGTIKASEINRTSFFGEAFKLGLSIEKIDLQGDGNNDDARLGVWMEGKLLRNYYYIDNVDEVGTGMSVFPYLVEEEMYQNTVTVTDVTETNGTFTTTLGLDDMNASGVAAGIYGYHERNTEVSTALKPKNTAEKDGNLDNAIFSTNVRFSKEHAKLFYGCPTESQKGWHGLWIGADGNAGETFTANYSGGKVDFGKMQAGVAGVQLFDNTYKLSISTRYVDSDGDDVFDDLEVGFWFNDVLYNNTYYYVDSTVITSELKPNLAVYAANEDGHIVLGNYTQNTATEIIYCADEFDYFVDGDTVTVSGEVQGTTWNTNMPGTYAVEYTNTTDMGTSTFKENVLVYKTNDVTADGVVKAADLIAMKKLAAGQRSDTTAAGKKAVGYVEGSAWYTTEVEDAMYNQLLADANTIQAKVMSDEILGETGSQPPEGTATYITSLGETEEGTSVIGISDVADAASRTYTTDIDGFDGSGLDFVLDFDTDRDIKVLQITDTQIIDAAQCRTENRLSAYQMTAWATDQMDNVLFNELRTLIAKEKPDLIVMTGDNVYGEFDDKGTTSQALIAVMDEFKIPWAPIFGNHDNETALGVSKQCEQFAESKYCLFNRRNEIGGNGNYAIGISVQGNLQRTIFMMDSNGCSNLSGVTNQADKDAVTTSMIFHDEQMAWYRTVAARVNEHAGTDIPSFLCIHIPLAEVTTALVETGYQTKADATVNGSRISNNYTIGDIVAKDSAWTYEKDTNKNFGFKESDTIGSSAMSEFILPHLKAAGTDGTFFGHQHVNAVSVEWEGIRFTYGLKTGRYDASPNQTGGTVITLKGSAFDVNHAIINNLDAE